MALAVLPGASRRGVPDGYRRQRVDGARVITHASAHEWALQAIRSHGTLHGWAADQEDVENFAGRGTVYAIRAQGAGPDGRDRWAVRHYRRGGAMAGFLEDRYLRIGASRPGRELLASTTARLRGVSTPAVVAAGIYPSGLYYRCDLVTEVVPSAKTLADALHETDGSRDWLTAMAAAGDLVDALGEAGVFHVDLNAHNILFEEGDFRRPWVVDLDRARVRNRPDTDAKEKMKARLTRSIVKVGTPTGESLGSREVLQALRGSA